MYEKQLKPMDQLRARSLAAMMREMGGGKGRRTDPEMANVFDARLGKPRRGLKPAYKQGMAPRNGSLDQYGV